MIRVSCYIDGFNLYHAIDELGQNHLKWVDLWRLSSFFVDPHSQELTAVSYFSAFATWLPDACSRHRAYVAALKMVGVTTNMSKFFKRTRHCKLCRRNYLAHEEKQSDVKAALSMLDDAYLDEFDKALLISRDSDLTPVIRLIKERFPDKEVVVIAPPNRRHSKDLAKWADDQKKIKLIQLKNALLPKVLRDKDGQEKVRRPTEYDPP